MSIKIIEKTNLEKDIDEFKKIIENIDTKALTSKNKEEAKNKLNDILSSDEMKGIFMPWINSLLNEDLTSTYRVKIMRNSAKNSNLFWEDDWKMIGAINNVAGRFKKKRLKEWGKSWKTYDNLKDSITEYFIRILDHSTSIIKQKNEITENINKNLWNTLNE